MTTSFDMALQKYENLIIISDFIIHTYKSDSPTYDRLNDFCNIFDHANIINEKTCFTKNHSSRIALLLSNKPNSLQLSHITEALLATS